VKHNEDAYAKFISAINVPRETLDKLHLYHDLLMKWQPRINLVSPKTLDEAWSRHFLDSAQLFYLLSDTDTSIFDLGSGAGFPGLILSVMGASQITLLESDQRKCIFLSEVIRQTKSSANIFNGRIETFPEQKKADIVTSRACASLNKLLSFAYPLLNPDGECLFLKGRGVEEEVKEAQERWAFHVEHTPSISDTEGCIIRISHLHPH
jgi:16S rRNA (guanine527-N7)-methyltransferase